MSTDESDSELPPTRELSWIPLLGAFAIVALIVVLTLVLGGGQNRGVPDRPRVDGKGALQCPGAFAFDPDATWVPNKAFGVAVATSLAPDESPSQVTVCRYAAPSSAVPASLALQGRVVLGGDLDRVRTALVGAKVRAGHTPQGVGATGGAVYLIGLTYPEGAVWVSVGTPADGNGEVVTTTDLRTDTAAAYTAKRWP